MGHVINFKKNQTFGNYSPLLLLYIQNAAYILTDYILLNKQN